MGSSTGLAGVGRAESARAVDERGLDAAEASRRLAELGPNEIERGRPTPVWLRFGRQLASPLVLLLLAATPVAAALGEIVDAVAIAAIVVLDAIVGFLQEGRAERAVLALRQMTAPRARVRREGRDRLVPAREVVPGDLLVLEPGDVVAADARVLAAHDLATAEAALTGESLPVAKDPTPLPETTPLAERRDRVFLGTAVVRGTGVARVGATGMASELGRVASLLGEVEKERTPLERRLEGVGRTLLALCLGIVGLVSAIGLAQGRPPYELLLTAVSLAVAAVPEGLPAVVTIALALGVQRMSARRVLVRRLPAVETLGCATVVCTDKTGTLTTGEMTVRETWGDADAILAAAAACADAELAASGRGGVGDPTELALLAAAAARGIRRETIERERPRVSTRPFDVERKRMSVLRADGVLYVKGAVEVVLPRCAGETEEAEAASREMAARGLRVLAVALGAGERESALRLLGLVGLADPPRAEAVAAVAAARAAGLRPVMITGDHPATARAIARELGILRPEEDPEEAVHARATPEDKLRIVRAWKARGAVVAMTGDGVNDAPALREAHIGIAMGRTATEVTREAADMVLADDNFASIVAAVAEGRGIFANIRKTLVYLLAGNAAELTLMLAAALAGLPLPLLPLHLLWINLVTDGLPALALVTDPPERGTLERPPRPADEPMLGGREWRTVVVTGLVEAAVTLAVFAWAYEARGLETARSLAFSTLVFSELLRSFAARSPTLTFAEVGAFTNLRLLAVVALSMLAQIAIHELPMAARLFRLGPLGVDDGLLALAAGLVTVTVLELWKLGRRWRAGPACRLPGP